MPRTPPLLKRGRLLLRAAVQAPSRVGRIEEQNTHSLTRNGLEVIQSLTPWAEKELGKYLKPASQAWQPSDWLPDPASDTFCDELTALRSSASNLPLDYLVVLVGDMVTEEALPSYMNMLNTLDGTRDNSGADSHAWARWTRSWTAEENRHGDLLNKYLYLCGRVNMRSVEVSVQNLIGAGLAPGLENNPYLCFIYTSFQERATKISHGNTARLAGYHGDELLAKICAHIAADEARHESAYCAIVEQLFARDPQGTVIAFADMLKKGILMPAHLLNDGWHESANQGQNLFRDYASLADSLGVYTTSHYADITAYLLQRWKVAELRVSGAAAEAQDFLLAHPSRVRRLAHLQVERRVRDRRRGGRHAQFSWLGKRLVVLD